MTCNNCGEELNIGDDYVEFLGNIYCSDDCVHEMVDSFLHYGIVEEER